MDSHFEWVLSLRALNLTFPRSPLPGLMLNSAIERIAGVQNLGWFSFPFDFLDNMKYFFQEQK